MNALEVNNIPSFVNFLSKFSERIAIIHNEKKISYRDFTADIVKVAAVLRSSYEISGEPVIYSLENKYHQLVAIFAIIYAGGIAIPMKQSVCSNEIDQSWISDTQARLFLCGDYHVLDLHGDIRSVYFSKLLSCCDSIISAPDSNDVALVLYTSGTTGSPKGVALTQNNLISTAHSINEFMGVNNGITEYIPIPLTHSFGFGRCRCVFLVGGTAVMDDGLFNPLTMMQRMLRYRCDSFSGVPVNMTLLMRYSEKQLQVYGAQIKFVEIGSSPMPLKDKKKICNLLPNANICMHYGLTEASRSCFINFRTEVDKLATVGRASPGVEIAVVDDDNKPISDGAMGRLAMRGPNVAKEYYLNKDLTEKHFGSGWFISSDMGYIDQNKYIHLTGRSDYLINVGGEKILPEQIEKLIGDANLIPGDYAVVGIINEESIYGIDIVLYTTVTGFAPKELQSLSKSLLKAGLKPIFLPTKYNVVKSIPVTVNGKIRRDLLG